MGLFSLLSLAGLCLIIIGFDQTRGLASLYTPPAWAGIATLVLMWPALILLVASQMPTGLIRKMTRHPMLVAVKLWAFGHLLANGELNSVLLFGSFLAFAIIDRILVKRRGDHGPDPSLPSRPFIDVLAVLLGSGIWAGFILWWHPVLFGVPAIG